MHLFVYLGVALLSILNTSQGSGQNTAHCPAGKTRSADTAGQCCWPEQVWSSAAQRCIGAHSCLRGWEKLDDGCVKPCNTSEQEIRVGGVCRCSAGREKSVDTHGHCCWPGQLWATRSSRCVGTPSACPEGTGVSGEQCSRYVLDKKKHDDPDDDVLMDYRTKQLWHVAAAQQSSHLEAMLYCRDLRIQGIPYRWRLPTIEELSATGWSDHFEPQGKWWYWTNSPAAVFGEPNYPVLLYKSPTERSEADSQGYRAGSYYEAKARCIAEIPGAYNPGAPYPGRTDLTRRYGSARGCGCRLAPDAPSPPSAFYWLVATLLTWKRLRQRRRKQSAHRLPSGVSPQCTNSTSGDHAA